MILWSVFSILSLKTVQKNMSGLHSRSIKWIKLRAHFKCRSSSPTSAPLPPPFHLYVCKSHYASIPVCLCIYSWKISNWEKALYNSIFHSCYHQLSPILYQFNRKEATITPLLFPTVIKNLHHKSTYWITSLVGLKKDTVKQECYS